MFDVVVSPQNSALLVFGSISVTAAGTSNVAGVCSALTEQGAATCTVDALIQSAQLEFSYSGSGVLSSSVSPAFSQIVNRGTLT